MRPHWNELPDDWSDDEKLAGDFLAGWPEKVDGKLTHRYFEPDSEEEAAALAALLRVLRDHTKPPPYAIQHRLAALLDPTHALEHRKFSITNRVGGVQPDYRTDVRIADFIEEKLAKEKCTVEVAIDAAEQEFGISARACWRLWGEHQARKRTKHS